MAHKLREKGVKTHTIETKTGKALCRELPLAEKIIAKAKKQNKGKKGGSLLRELDNTVKVPKDSDYGSICGSSILQSMEDEPPAKRVRKTQEERNSKDDFSGFGHGRKEF